MIAHIRQLKQPQPATPIIRARQMVAETLLSAEPAKRRWVAVRKALLFGALAFLAAVAALAYYLWW